ncbi:MAG: nucleotidyltransferase family protein [Clostridia bacterium]|nr:nucleotidyltransferase family protein [Clostridia bacterium]
MTTVAVICEYNLFHNGHARLISAIKERFGEDTCVVSLMSGNFTQRGLPAATDKYLRAHAALLSGSDLTLELPAPYAFSVAERFATAGVELADKLGCIDYLAFGSECADVSRLTLTAERFSSEEYESALKAALSTADGEESYIRTRQRVYEELYGEIELLPNDQLGVEYLTALSKTLVRPAVFARTGSETATESRAAFLSGDDAALSRLVPRSALELYEKAVPASYAPLSAAVLSFLRLADPATLAGYEGMNHDLAYRFVRVAKESRTIDEFFDTCATKKYTRARVRRGVLNCMLGVKADDFSTVGHTLVLSANEKGCELLSRMKKCSAVPVYTKGSSVEDVISARSDALYTLALHESAEAGAILRKSPIILK